MTKISAALGADAGNENRLNASDPSISAWVAANAGAGKTHLLVSRVLRLLVTGVAPSRILCITYTKAAAAEMRARLLAELSRWAIAGDDILPASLQALIGGAPAPHITARARSLFAELVEAPEGVRIQTIHAFCQSVLKRFPLEAGMAPHFRVMDERAARELLREASQRLFSRSLHAEDDALKAALCVIAAHLSEMSFHALSAELAAQRRKLRESLECFGDSAALQARLHALLEIGGEDDFFRYGAGELPLLQACAQKLLAADGQDNRRVGTALALWLECAEAEREARLTAYGGAFIKKDGEPYQRVCNLSAGLSQAEHQALLAEQARHLAHAAQCRARKLAELSLHLYTAAAALLAEYERLKGARALTDFDDLVITACRLLETSGIAPWVMFKLDGGIDHILVDEAQDTSGEQWRILERLTEEFFAGAGRAEQGRTLFVVGDLKQSIFRFQGAEPAEFVRGQAFFAQRVQNAAKPWQAVTLPESFRSAAPVLRAVDAVFASASAGLGVAGEEMLIRHTLTRMGEAGRVELWPLLQAVKEEVENAPWQPLRERMQRERPQAALAARIAKTIRRWLDAGEVLPSANRPIMPGDILILVQTRGELVDHLLRALAREGVPVAGIDRLKLTESLAVQDLLALGAFLLLPEDDYSLACVLKSSLGGVSEEQLFTLCSGRGQESLWQRLKKDPALAHITAVLEDMLARTDFLPPYELYMHLLESLGVRGRILGRMGAEAGDVLDEFLDQALRFENMHTPSLQGFLHWLRQGETVVKRDMEQGGNTVRIMTVHGAKGLEAPIVFLPDTAQGLKGRQGRIFWHEEAGGHFALWPPSKAEDTALTRALREREQALELAEHRRLLYVAMTRARDRLYIAGAAKSARAVPEPCWYRLMESALQPLCGQHDTPEGPVWRLECAQEKTVAPARLPALPDALPLPGFYRRPAAQEASVRILSPSRLEADDAVALSPAAGVELYRHGVHMHRLLQYLPGLPPAQRKEAGEALLRRAGLNEEEQALVLPQVLNLLAEPRFAPLFAEGSRAEVPIAGRIRRAGGEEVFAGQIDRLCLHGEAVWIVDYKTNQRVPADAARVPRRYVRQMAAYRALLEEIYPSRRIRCFLLWTAGPTLMELPAAPLEQVLAA